MLIFQEGCLGWYWWGEKSQKVKNHEKFQSGRHSGRRWKKMDEKKKVRKKYKKRSKKKCLESAGDGLGTLVGVQIAQKKINPT